MSDCLELVCGGVTLTYLRAGGLAERELMSLDEVILSSSSISADSVRERCAEINESEFFAMGAITGLDGDQLLAAISAGHAIVAGYDTAQAILGVRRQIIAESN
jgi:hypothetical protein